MPRNSGEGHSGEAGRVTPGRGRGQVTRPPTPRPADAPTSSNMLVEHTVDTSNGQRVNPVLGQQTHPHRRTHEKPTPLTPRTTTNRPAQRPKPRPANEPRHRTHEKPAPPTPATATRTTHTTASSYAHNLEHPYNPRHRQRQRPLASNATTTPQPAPRLWRRTLRRSR